MMRFSPRLYAQHLGWTFKKHWQIQGKRVPSDNGALKELQKAGILVKDPSQIVKPQIEREIYDVPCNNDHVENDATNIHLGKYNGYVYADENVLLEGMPQAQVLTKSILVKGLPEKWLELLDSISIPSGIEHLIPRVVLASYLFDAEQEKLPKVKLSERPGYNLPREYGICQYRRNRLMLNKFLMECEKLATLSYTSRRRLLDDVRVNVLVPKDEDLIQLNIKALKMITAKQPIEPIKGKFESDIPNMYPIKCTISLPHRNICDKETQFPFNSKMKCLYPHTIVSFFDHEKVRNLHGSRVNNSQFKSRTLLSAFAVAVSRAKQVYGATCPKELPKPIVVQSIQTDGHIFHFGIFQLNTLELDGKSNLSNYWFEEENMHLYSHCEFRNGQPTLEGYNRNVFRHFYAFYRSV
ncbi:mitochondrial ribosomal protein L37 [Haematobia irritans]|uniref:mitochondrial ribosomal protein L37 n=1 Tax=Haematobia irritans TaxID=7368 RepID=UPI003F506674